VRSVNQKIRIYVKYMDVCLGERETETETERDRERETKVREIQRKKDTMRD